VCSLPAGNTVGGERRDLIVFAKGVTSGYLPLGDVYDDVKVAARSTSSAQRAGTDAAS
jgi:adenosylmethionine-8-amino-7-oxononanoate aminotransferase